jgi:flagellar biosynthesis/type III secretory pathway chaperone
MSVQRSEVHGHLQRVLAEEGRLLAELEGVLRQETSVLRGDDADAIARIGDRRHRYIDSLSKLDAERSASCRMLSFGTGRAALDQMLAWADPSGALGARWSANLQLARRCKAINDQNGAIVSAQLGRVQRLLARLRGASAPPVYSARGARYGNLGLRDLGCA